jgi:four helix bundle protein
VNNYKDLIIWQKAVDLSVKVYELTKDFPKDEMYGLTSQMRRCSVSIASNIAEGSGRNTKKDFNNFLGISYGSICELETQLIIAKNVGFLEGNKLEVMQRDINELQKMIWAFKRSLKLQD